MFTNGIISLLIFPEIITFSYFRRHGFRFPLDLPHDLVALTGFLCFVTSWNGKKKLGRVMVIFCTKNGQFSINFHDNLKNKNRKISSKTGDRTVISILFRSVWKKTKICILEVNPFLATLRSRYQIWMIHWFLQTCTKSIFLSHLRYAAQIFLFYFSSNFLLFSIS